MRNLTYIFLIACLVACGGDGDDRRDDSGSSTTPRPAVPGPSEEPDEEPPPVDEGPGEKRPVREELRLTVKPVRDKVETGAAIPVRLTLTNAGTEPVRLYDPVRGLSADLEFKVTLPDERTVLIRQHREIPEDKVTEDDLVTLSPGEAVSVEMDLGPTLRSAGDGALGVYGIEVTFTGGYQGRRITMDLWNRGRTREAVAPRVTIEVVWPAALRAKGLTREDDAKVEEILVRIQRDGRLTSGAKSDLLALGTRVYPLLVSRLALASSRQAPLRGQAWSVFAFLLESGEEAHRGLAASSGDEHPAARMLRRLLDPEGDRDRVRLNQVLSSRRKRERLQLTLALDRGERKGRTVLTIFGSGRVTWIREQGDAERTREAAIGAADLDSLFEALAAERPTALEGVRRFGLPDEGRVSIELVLLPVGGRGPTETLWRLDAWEEEASRWNPALSRVLTAIRAAERSLPR